MHSASPFAAALAALILVAAGPARAVSWQPVPSSELTAGAAPAGFPAPAEAIFRRITVDDSAFPRERKVREYVRYKIFDPDKATALAQVAQFSISGGDAPTRGDIEIAARVVNPDGSVRVFGRQALQERPIVRSASDGTWFGRLFSERGAQVSETFLAVSGIEPGAVLEIQSSYTERSLPWDYTIVLQQEGIPARVVDFVYDESTSSLWMPHVFTLNAAARGATVERDESGAQVRVEARDVPPLYHEPFSGPVPGYALTFVAEYVPRRSIVPLDPQTAPWGGYAARAFRYERDRARITPRIARLAAALTRGSGSDFAKAAVIHRYVQALHQRFLAAAGPARQGDRTGLHSLDQLLDFERHPRLRIDEADFVWLAIALYRAAGWEAQTVMLPERSRFPFDPARAGDLFLPNLAARVRIDGRWSFSYPADADVYAFGELPWEAQGSEGLLAAPGTQQFVPAPFSPAAASRIRNTGTFRLSPDGTLRGEASTTFTGCSAAVVRDGLRLMSVPARERYFRDRFETEFAPAVVSVGRLSGTLDPDAPLTVSYAVEWPGYAVRAGDRLLVRPSVFRAHAPSPFPDSARHYPFEFPYRWSEEDRVVLAIPDGYGIEGPLSAPLASLPGFCAVDEPPSLPGAPLSYRCSITRERPGGSIVYRRDFSSSVIELPASAIRTLKPWYDRVAESDQFELALSKAPDAGAPRRGPIP